MSNNQYETMVEAFADLKQKGFSSTFNVVGNQFYCVETMKFYDPDHLTIKEFHRFEGNSDYNDMAIIYAIESDDRQKGVIVDAFGTYADTHLYQLIQKMHTEK